MQQFQHSCAVCMGMGTTPKAQKLESYICSPTPETKKKLQYQQKHVAQQQKQQQSQWFHNPTLLLPVKQSKKDYTELIFMAITSVVVFLYASP